jgi:hypothetical protein
VRSRHAFRVQFHAVGHMKNNAAGVGEGLVQKASGGAGQEISHVMLHVHVST